MVSSTLIKLSSPVARSCLIALSASLLIDAILMIFAAINYPYLIDYYNDDLYITGSRAIAIVYSGSAIVAILISVSTAIASYKNATNYVVIHAGITGVFLPATILVYFTTSYARYKASDYIEDYKQMIVDFRISSSHRRKELMNLDNQSQNHGDSTSGTTSAPRILLSSFVNLIDHIQTKFSCCGVDSAQDWIKAWNGYITPTCCKEQLNTTSIQWATMFNVEQDHVFKHCSENNSYHLGCLVALKEDEHSKHAWLGDLIVFMIVITIMNTIVSFLLYGLSKTEDSSYEGNELSEIGPTADQPTITSIRHRPSVVHNLGASTENIAARAQAVRFNISNTPRTSISGPTKFSAAARRGSSFI